MGLQLKTLINGIGIFLCIISATQATFSDENFKSKYEYKYSFKGPNLAQAGQGIPFWNHSFDAFPGEDQVRVVPSLRAKVGAVWSKFPFPGEEWKVEISFRVHGRGRLGADGFVLWYVEQPNVYGPVFGSMDQWKGLGLFFDSYDNDGMKNNPYISVIVNDGTVSYSHETDGSKQMQGGCSRDFRNRPYPVKARIIYADNQLEVYIDSGSSATEDYEFCTVINDIKLPKDYYFGISAATGALADDHDILKFQTWSLTKKTAGEEEPGAVDEAAQKRIEAQKKLEEEYEKNLQDFYTDQKKFQEENPDKVKQDFGKPEDLFQGEASVELRAVFEVQSVIKKQISDLTKSVVMIMEKQDMISSKLDQDQPTDIEVAKSHQVENIMKMQRSTQDSITELQKHVNFLKSNSEALKINIAKIGSNTGGSKDVGNPYESKQQLAEIVKKVDSIYVGVTSLNNQQQKAQPRIVCPDPEMPPCVSSVVLIIIAALQVIIIIAYHSFKQSREDAAKKFF